ncbi:hypothetical protein R3I93_018117 [Phoxinus phoxinus]|uniref:Uncharacterized protein n=1 Tax=Phoxinus phoxinus TaxID=58324 RepID=A0AAN9CFT5_9TELE
MGKLACDVLRLLLLMVQSSICLNAIVSQFDLKQS